MFENPLALRRLGRQLMETWIVVVRCIHYAIHRCIRYRDIIEIQIHTYIYVHMYAYIEYVVQLYGFSLINIK